MEATKELEIKAVPLRVVYDSDSFNIVSYMDAATKRSFTAVGGHLCSHCDCILHGTWTRNAKYGERFSVSFYEEIRPDSGAGIEKYLAGAGIKGVGKVTASRIVEMYGDGTFDAMKDPACLARVKGISEKKAREIVASYLEKAAMEDYFKVAGEYGVSASHVTDIFRKFRHMEGGAETLKARPYLMCMCDGVSFGTIDAHARRMPGFDPYGADRVMFGVLEAMRSFESDGHCFVKQADLTSRAVRALSDCALDRKRLEERAVKAEAALMKDGAMVYDLGVMYRRPLYEAERGTAEKLSLMMGKERRKIPEEKLAEALKSAEEKSGLTLSEKQRDAVRMALTNNVSIITGGPGRGKTAVQNVLLTASVMLDPGLTYALCAPTGRAAQQMAEKAKRPATTIHRLLGISVARETNAREMEDAMSGIDLVVMDEASMCDMQLFWLLVRSMRADARLVLIGDADQLESVQAGNVLSDLVACGAVPCTVLDHNFRQGEGSLIVGNADRIRFGKTPLSWDGSGFRLLPAGNEDDAARSVLSEAERLLGSGVPAGDIQVLTPFREKTKAGARELNTALQGLFNPESLKKAQMAYGQRVFREGDRVIHLLHNEEEVSNGDIGYVVSVDTVEKEVDVVFATGAEKTYGRDDLPELELAYALTVHKSQGSEYPHVIMPFTGVFGRMRTRRLLYTAVTRAKKSFCLAGDEASVAFAARNAGTVRNTYLAYRLVKLMDGRGIPAVNQNKEEKQ